MSDKYGYYCRTCHINDQSKFYPSITSKCKACQKSVAIKCDRNPMTSREVNCIKCGKVSLTPKKDYCISTATDLYLDQCNVCKGQRIEYDIPPVDPHRYSQLCTWVQSLNPSKEDIKILKLIYTQMDN